MPTKAKKAKTAKKASKPSSKNRIPTMSHPDIVAEQHRPMAIDAVPAMSDKLFQLWADIGEWKTACRSAFTAGKTAAELPSFPASKLPNPNAGRMSRSAYEKLIDEYNEALEAGTALPTIPARYNPVEQELITALGCTVIRKGQLPKEPDNWNEKKNGPWKDSAGKSGGIKSPRGWDDKKYGSWFHEDEEGERTIASGWILDSSRQRTCHKPIDKLVENPDDNVVTLNGTRYIVAAGSKASHAAVYQIDCSDVGSYGAIWDVRRRMAMAKVKGVGNLVWRIEDRPNAGSAVKTDMGHGNVNFFMPGMLATPGYLHNGAKEMMATQIRKAISDDTKGIKFKPLKDPIEGNWVLMDDAYPEIKKAWKASKKDATILNSLVQCRVSDTEGYPFGFRGASVAIVPCFRWSYDGSKYHLEMSLVVGARQNSDYCVSKQEAKALYNEEHAEVEAVEAVEVVTPKAKAETEPKKPRKKKAAVSAAAPIDADTIDDPAGPLVGAETDDFDENAEVEGIDSNARDLAEAEVEAANDEN